MAEYKQYKVQKGDTLWDIAASIGIPPSQRTSELWKSWGFTGDPRKLPVGFTLNIPTQTTTPATPTTPTTSTTPTTTNQTQLPTTNKTTELTQNKTDSTQNLDYSASFSYLVKAGQDLSNLTKEAQTLFPKPPEPGTQEELMSPEYRAKEAATGIIKAEVARTRESIEDQAKLADISRRRALEQIAASPAASRAVIEEFVAKSDASAHEISRALERLQAEEDNAIAQNDLNYANIVRQKKIDYYNTLQNIIQNNINFVTSAYNMMLTGKQVQEAEEQRAETKASNYLNTTISAYAGSGYTLDTLPADVATNLRNNAAILGLDESTINRMLVGGTDLQIIHDETTGWIIGMDKKTGQIMFKHLMPGRTGESTSTEQKFTSAEIVRALGAEILKQFQQDPVFKNNKGAKVSLDTYYDALMYWKATDISSLKNFFLAFPKDMIDIPEDKQQSISAYGTIISGDPRYQEIETEYNNVMRANPLNALIESIGKRIQDTVNSPSNQSNQ